MPSKVVSVPGVGNVEFPDTMGDDEISAVIKKQHPELEPSGMDRMLNNIPGSIYKAVTHPTFPGMPVGSSMGPKDHLTDTVRKNVSDTWEGIKHFANDPLGTVKEHVINDPVGSALTAGAGARALFPGAAQTAETFAGGASKAAAENVRPVLDKFSLWHPLKNIGTMYDAAKNTMEGGTRAVKAASGDTSLPDPGDMPNAGKVKQQMLQKTPTSRPVQGRGNNNVVGGDPGDLPPTANQDVNDIPGGQSGSIKKQALKTTPRDFTNRNPGSYKQVGKDPNLPQEELGPSKDFLPGFFKGESGESDVDAMNNVYRKVFKPALTFSGQEHNASTSTPETPSWLGGGARKATAGTETRPVESPGVARPQGAGTPPNAPKPFSTSDAKQPDIHDQIAQEGSAKRAADSRAKYEDVYQNVIKGQYTPEQLRNLSPEEHTQIDMRIKNMKHPEEHPQAGKKKYGTGLNPVMVEPLASRLETEQQ